MILVDSNTWADYFNDAGTPHGIPRRTGGEYQARDGGGGRQGIVAAPADGGRPAGSVAGHSTSGHLLLVHFTEREGVIRLVSARRATRHEREDYERFEKP